MGRQVKCKICGNKIDGSNAYKYIHTMKSGKKQNLYYCNREEFHKDREKKRYYRKCQLIIDDIVGYTCINKKKISMLVEIHKADYDYKLIYECIKQYKDEIIQALDLKQIVDEYPMLCYIFAIIRNKIKDFSLNEKYDKRTITPSVANEDIVKEVTTRRRDRKPNKPKSIMDIIKESNKEE